MKFLRSLAGLIVLLMFVVTANGQTLEWMRQNGTDDFDYCYGVSSDGNGNIYIAGETAGDFGGQQMGDSDAFVAKLDDSGNVVWSRQLGSLHEDRARDVIVDLLGNVFIGGHTRGALQGPNLGNTDAFVSKYDSNGNFAWTCQFGTEENNSVQSVSVDGQGNVFVAGSTRGDLGGESMGDYDAYISKYDSNGALLWIRQFGSTEADLVDGVSFDGLGNVYVGGNTWGDLGGINAGNRDGFVCKFDTDGVQLWCRQFGGDDFDFVEDVAADVLGNVYAAGQTFGDLDGGNAGSADAFICKYDSSGNMMWIRQIGTNVYDRAQSVSADGLGNAYVAGSTSGSLAGPAAGNGDSFVAKYDSAGNSLWIRQFGSQGIDDCYGTSADGTGDVYIGGMTDGNLGGQQFGSRDYFVAKFDDVPVPITAIADAYTVFRGFQIGGELSDTFASDDSYLIVEQGLVLSAQEAPIWLIFDGIVGTGVSDVDVQIESNAGTPGLRYTIEFWNWSQGSYDTVVANAESFEMDYVENYGGIVSDHVSASGAVRSRIGWRPSGIILGLPWEIHLDQLVWNAAN